MNIEQKIKVLKKGWRWWYLLMVPLIVLLCVPLPDPLFNVTYSTVLQSREGTLLGARIAHDEQWRFPVSDSIPARFRQSILLYEDEYFYQHPGVNPISFGKAVVQNVKAGRIVRGGSTLTMQVVRMALGNQSRTYIQKALELILACKLEIFYSKQEILNLYVAHAPFGSNVVGLTAAAWRYYHKSPENLSWAECATLAVLPNSPSLIYPGKNEQTLKQKRDFLLQKIYKHGSIDSLTYRLALLEKLPGEPHKLPDLAPRLLSRSIKDGQQGKVVHSTISTRLQSLVKDKVLNHHQKMAGNHVYNAAAIILDVNTGQALAYVGNVDGPGEHGQFVDIITANRSTGSLLKPVLYGAALDEGILLPYQLLPDIPMFYQGFAPQNFDKKFYGAVPADVSLIRSLNVPFVHLLREYGYEKFHHQLKAMGLSSLSQPAGHYGLSLILGGAESSLWEVTSLYAGMVRTIKKSQRTPHQQSEEPPLYFPNSYMLNMPSADLVSDTREIISPLSVWYTLQSMQQVHRPEEQQGWERFPSSGRIAWKTGTSFGFRDAWAVGVNDRYVVGVWMGNADGEGRPGLIGVKAAAPLLFDIFEDLDGDIHFAQPLIDATETKVCVRSGYPAGESCPESELLFTSAKNKQGSCPFHQQVHLDEEEEFQVNSSCYPVSKIITRSWFVLPPSQAWYYRQYHMDYETLPPFVSGCQHAGKKLMEIIYPNHQTRLFIPNELDGRPGKAVFSIAHQKPDALLYWHLDNLFLGQTKHTHEFGLNPGKGVHTLYVIDEDGNALTHQFEVISDRRANTDF